MPVSIKVPTSTYPLPTQGVTTTWGTPLNASINNLATGIGGVVTITVSSSSVTTLTADQSAAAIIVLTGSVGGVTGVIIPANISGSWIFYNGTAYTSYITPQSANGFNVAIQPYSSANIYSPDGLSLYSADTNVTPAGTVISFAGVNIPAGYLNCDGAAYSQAKYPALYAAIGTTWGGSSGNFNVPDLRGVFLRGTGTNANSAVVAAGGANGQAVGTYAADTYLNHSHTITDPGHFHSTPTTGPNGAGGGGLVGFGTGTAYPTDTKTTGITVNASTTGGSETKPKNFGILYCIYAGRFDYTP